MSITYQNPQIYDYDIKLINELINSNDINKIIDVILGLSLYGENRDEIQKFIINLLANTDNIQIKKTCLTALSHIIRIDRHIINDGIDIINTLKFDELYSNHIIDLMEDIDIFTREPA